MRTTSESPRSRPAARAGAEARRAPERFTRAGCAADARRVDADARTGSATAADAVVKADIVSICVALCALGCVVRPRIDQSRVRHKKRTGWWIDDVANAGQRSEMRPRRAVRAWRVSRWQVGGVFLFPHRLPTGQDTTDGAGVAHTRFRSARPPQLRDVRRIRRWQRGRQGRTFQECMGQARLHPRHGTLHAGS